MSLWTRITEALAALAQGEGLAAVDLENMGQEAWRPLLQGLIDRGVDSVAMREGAVTGREIVLAELDRLHALDQSE